MVEYAEDQPVVVLDTKLYTMMVLVLDNQK